ncbi:MAG: hypothetical protein QXP52_02035 [Candidatus Aenigmatarchaeota archaeon]
MKIVKCDNFNEEKFKKIVSQIKDVITPNSELNIEFVNNIPKTPTGKYKFTISKIDIYSKIIKDIQ